jgi:hypothetical protein
MFCDFVTCCQARPDRFHKLPFGIKMAPIRTNLARNDIFENLSGFRKFQNLKSAKNALISGGTSKFWKIYFSGTT